MNHWRALIILAILLGLAGGLTACGGAQPTTTPESPGLDASYPGAVNLRSQLLLGTVRLEETNGPALSKEQAAKLLPLWQLSRSLIGSGTASQAELDAVTNQILAEMTAEQIQAIGAMRLVQADMQTFNQSLGGTAPDGASGGVPGQGKSLSPAERATRQAQSGRTGGSTASVDHLIGILERIASK